MTVDLRPCLSLWSSSVDKVVSKNRKMPAWQGWTSLFSSCSVTVTDSIFQIAFVLHLFVRRSRCSVTKPEPDYCPIIHYVIVHHNCRISINYFARSPGNSQLLQADEHNHGHDPSELSATLGRKWKVPARQPLLRLHQADQSFRLCTSRSQDIQLRIVWNTRQVTQIYDRMASISVSNAVTLHSYGQLDIFVLPGTPK